MTELPLRARTVTEIVDASFQLYRARWATLVTVSLLLYAPLIALGMFATEWLGVLRALAVGLMAFVVSGSMALVVEDALHDRASDVPAVLRRLRPHVGALIGAGIGVSLLLSVGFILLVVPGIVMVPWTVCVPAIVVFEREAAAKDPIARGRRLARGNTGHVWGTFLLATVIVYVTTLAITVVAEMIADVSGSDPRVATFVSESVVALLAPISGLAIGLLYFDLRIRTEGYDLEHELDRLTSASAIAAAGATSTIIPDVPPSAQ